MCETRTCKRCNGTGNKNTPVAHLGVPGLCYGCDGTGVQFKVGVDVLKKAEIASAKIHMNEIEEKVEALKAIWTGEDVEAPSKRPLCWIPLPKVGPTKINARKLRKVARREEQLEELREAWRTANQLSKNPTAKRARWVSQGSLNNLNKAAQTV